MRWCRNFVLPLNLCPWAAASIKTEDAIQIYSVASQQEMQESVYSVSRLFYDGIMNHQQADPSVAISFVICEDESWSFTDFFDWFCKLEEDYWDDDDDLQSKVTLAPFHPDWTYGDDDDDLASLSFEKKAPHPTVSLVWAPVVDAAGEVVTNKIAEQNGETLSEKTVEELNELYEQHVYLSKDSYVSKDSS